MSDGFRQGYIRVRGHRLFYRSRGVPRKGSVLILHGGPSANHIMFLPFGDLAQFGYRVVWYDQSGCGRSQRPRDRANYTLERRAEEAEGVRRALRLGRVHLVGQSFGVPIALETAIRYPRSLRSLTLGSGFSSSKELLEEELRNFAHAPKRIQSTIRRFERLGDLKDPRYLRARQEYEQMPRRTSEGREAVLGFSRVRPWEVVQMWETLNPRMDRLFYGEPAGILSPAGGSMKDWDVSGSLGKIHVPTLVTVGRFDTLDIRLSRRIHRGIRGSKFVVFEKSGHGQLYSERDRYMQTMQKFLDSATARAS
jgi:proline iminopeptidase